MMSEGVASAVPAGASKSDTLYDKLNSLNDEIGEGLINLRGGRREDTVREIHDLRSISYRERSPEAVFSLLLFRKYSDEANRIKDLSKSQHQVQHGSASGMGGGGLSLVGDLPAFMYQADDESMLVGANALKTTTFQLRCVAVLFSLLTLGVISATPFITETDFNPHDHFEKNGCDVTKLDGEFNFRPYQLVLSIAVLAFVHNAIFLGYYWLPVNEHSGNKYVPGLAHLLGMIVQNPARGEEYSTRFSMFCRDHARTIECCIDGFLLIMALVAFVVALWVLQLPIEFKVTEEDGPNNIKSTEYYTLGTCFLTFSKQDCMDERSDPTSFISGALAMLFFLVITMVVCFLTSLRYIRQQLGPDATLGALFSRISSSLPGVGGGAGTGGDSTHSASSDPAYAHALAARGTGGAGAGVVGASSTGGRGGGLAAQVAVGGGDDEDVEVKL